MANKTDKRDKFKAIWLSHSSIADYLKCPRLYFLRNVYKDPITNHKITVMNPHLALGQIVHEVVESLSILPTEGPAKGGRGGAGAGGGKGGCPPGGEGVHSRCLIKS